MAIMATTNFNFRAWETCRGARIQTQPQELHRPGAEKNRGVDRAKLPMKCSADGGRTRPKLDRANTSGAVISSNLRAERSEGPPVRRNENPYSTPMGRASQGNQRNFPGETRILRARNARHAGRYGQQDSEQNNDDGFPPDFQGAGVQSAEYEAGMLQAEGATDSHMKGFSDE